MKTKSRGITGLRAFLAARRHKSKKAQIRRRLAAFPMRPVTARPDFPKGGTMATVRARLKRSRTA